MSMFRCDDCDTIRDSDDGCEESGNGFELICWTCAEERQAQAEEADDRRRDNVFARDFRRLGQ